MEILNSLFGRSLTPQERLREYQRTLERAQRELERERTKLEAQSNTLVSQIKTAAKEGKISTCKTHAKSLVSTRRYMQKFTAMKTQLQMVGLRIQTMRSTAQMGEAMRGAGMAMKALNSTTNLPGLSKIMQEFEKQSMMMGMKDEMISDAMDDVLEGDEDEEGEDEVVQKVLDEIGVGMGQQLGVTPSTLPISEINMAEPKSMIAEFSTPASVSKPATTAPAASAAPSQPSASAPAAKNDEQSLQARLDALRR